MTYGCGANDEESSATSSVSVRVEMADEYDGQEKPSPQNPEVEQRAGESTGELDLNGGTNAGGPAPVVDGSVGGGIMDAVDLADVDAVDETGRQPSAMGGRRMMSAMAPSGGHADGVAAHEDLEHVLLDVVLAELAADFDTTMSRYARSHGWPLMLANGQALVVTANPWPMVAGDHDQWLGTPMTVEQGFYWLVLPGQIGSRYKFTDGERWVPDPWSRAYEYDEFGEISFVRGGGNHLERWFDVGAENVASRTIRVWVPDQPIRAVLYMQDGQNLFSPTAPWGGWRLQTQIPDGVMIVGIDNSSARTWEYTVGPDMIEGQAVGGGAEIYAEYVESVVRPIVEAAYGEHGLIGVLGSSLGGLVSLYMAWRRPDVYHFSGSMSGTVGWGRIGGRFDTIMDHFRVAPPLGVEFFLDSGGPAVPCVDLDDDGLEDDAPSHRDNYCPTLQLVHLLQSLGWSMERDLWHAHDRDAPHNESAWSSRVHLPLQIFSQMAN